MSPRPSLGGSNAPVTTTATSGGALPAPARSRHALGGTNASTGVGALSFSVASPCSLGFFCEWSCASATLWPSICAKLCKSAARPSPSPRPSCGTPNGITTARGEAMAAPSTRGVQLSALLRPRPRIERDADDRVPRAARRRGEAHLVHRLRGAREQVLI